MSKFFASRASTAAVHKWLERMEEENQMWDRKIADEPFDASQFLRDCISYRKRSSKHIAVKKKFWWLGNFCSFNNSSEVVACLTRLMRMSWQVDYSCCLLFWSFSWLSWRSLSRWFSCSPLLQCCGKATRAWSSEISLFSVLVGPSFHSRTSLWTISRYCAFTHCCITSQSTLFFIVSLGLKHLGDRRASIDEWNGKSINANQDCQFAMAFVSVMGEGGPGFLDRERSWKVCLYRDQGPWIAATIHCWASIQ